MKGMVIKMKTTLEKLWNEYLLDECAVIDTDEEMELTRKTAELHKKVNALLNEEQQEVVEKYVDALYDIHALFAEKAFIKGCEFSVSFLWEARNIER